MPLPIVASCRLRDGADGDRRNDPDDPAIWIHPADPSKSLMLGTDKMESTGGLYVFGLDGALRQSIAPLDRPNNVDVEYGFRRGEDSRRHRCA